MSKNPEVDAYLAKKAYPLTAEIERVREIVLAVHPDIQETIKWATPTFVYKGVMASFFMNAKKHVSLMFQKGAFLYDSSGLLQGNAKEARTARFANMEEIETRKEDLKNVVLAWIKWMDGDQS